MNNLPRVDDVVEKILFIYHIDSENGFFYGGIGSEKCRLKQEYSEASMIQQTYDTTKTNFLRTFRQSRTLFGVNIIQFV